MLKRAERTESVASQKPNKTSQQLRDFSPQVHKGYKEEEENHPHPDSFGKEQAEAGSIFRSDYWGGGSGNTFCAQGQSSCSSRHPGSLQIPSITANLGKHLLQ